MTTDPLPPSTPFTLGCAWCDFKTLVPADMVTHMITSQHGLPPSFLGELDSSSLLQDFEAQIAHIQAFAGGAPLPANHEIQPVDEDDPDLPDQVREWMTLIAKKQARADDDPDGGA
jgi:hypothetical protein